MDSRAQSVLGWVVIAGAGLVAVTTLSACGGGRHDATTTLKLSTTTANPGTPDGPPSAGPPVLSNRPLSRLILSSGFSAPRGFIVEAMNPFVPRSVANYGAVRAFLTSPAGVEYILIFSPTTIPCVDPSCAGAVKTLDIGSAAPPASAAVFAPTVKERAECGYDPDGRQIGCDAIVRDEYISVTGNGARVSMPDAVTLLRAAIDYVTGLKTAG